MRAHVFVLDHPKHKRHSVLHVGHRRRQACRHHALQLFVSELLILANWRTTQNVQLLQRQRRTDLLHFSCISCVEPLTHLLKTLLHFSSGQAFLLAAVNDLERRKEVVEF